MQESTPEIVLGMVARAGIVTAHCFELIGGFHTLTIVAVLWSVEEIVSIQYSARHLHSKHKKEK
jgi:hypothetical protein